MDNFTILLFGFIIILIAVPFNSNMRIILMIICGVYCSYLVIISSGSELSANIKFRLILIVGLFIFSWTFFTDCVKYRKNSIVVSFIPTYIGLLIILTQFGQKKYVDSIFVPSLIIANYWEEYKDDLLVFEIELKTDGNYKIIDLNGDNYYGKYLKKDSLITLDRPPIDNSLQTNKLVIRVLNEKIDSINFEQEKYLIQLDSITKKEIDGSLRFRVTMENN